VGAVALGDSEGKLALGVVAVAESDDGPVVHHDDGVEVDRVRVVGVGQLLQRCPELEGAALGSDGAEGKARAGTPRAAARAWRRAMVNRAHSVPACACQSTAPT
jgi:hypothetical protein